MINNYFRMKEGSKMTEAKQKSTSRGRKTMKKEVEVKPDPNQLDLLTNQTVAEMEQQAEPVEIGEAKPDKKVKEEPKKEEYVNISNPEDNEIYDAPKKPSTPQEQMQMAIDSIEKRSKYLDEPNVISDEAVDNIVNSISFFDDEDDKN